MRFLFTLLLSVAAASAVHLTAPRAAAHDYASGSIRIGHPILAPPANGSDVTAGYLTLRNVGDTPDRLIGVSVVGAARVEIHETVELDGGVMRMQRIEGGVPIPAGGMVTFAPGGRHLMVIGIAETLREGDALPLVLEFARAGRVEVEAGVERPALGSRRGHTH
ncbi:MAG: copper chaperone PCu(A)C [Alphaproteobacteria bacterium]|nr:copper chaperone PCu(A)C [Alphaproteobacteria bacterium]